MEVLFVNKKGHQDYPRNKFLQILYNYLIDFGILQLFLHFPKIHHYSFLLMGDYLLEDCQMLRLE